MATFAVVVVGPTSGNVLSLLPPCRQPWRRWPWDWHCRIPGLQGDNVIGK